MSLPPANDAPAQPPTLTPPKSFRRIWALLALVLLVGAFLANRTHQMNRPPYGTHEANRPMSSALPWLTDANAAFAESKASGRPVLMVFNQPGCIFCTQLEQEVLSKPAFEDVARGRVVLADLDITVARRNMELIQRYGGEGTPTVVLANADGRLLGFYNGGSLPDWLAGQLGKPQATTAPEAVSLTPERFD